MSFKELILVGAMALALAACGGGDGGGDGGGGGGTAPIYSASTSPAPIDAATTRQYLFAALNTAVGEGGFAENSTRHLAAKHERSLLEQVSEIRAGVNRKSSKNSKESINLPLECTSGRGALQGTLNDSTGVGTLTQSFENCVLNGISYNGSISIYFSRWNETLDVPLDMDVTYAGYRLSLNNCSEQ